MRICIALALLSSFAQADTTTPGSKPAVKMSCGGYPQCGTLGAPCCLGDHLFLGKKGDRSTPLAAILERIEPLAVASPENWQAQLAQLAKFGSLTAADEPTLRRFPKIWELWTTLKRGRSGG
jgi:hypothetical protein